MTACALDQGSGVGAGPDGTGGPLAAGGAELAGPAATASAITSKSGAIVRAAVWRLT